jgi:paraquat-inducible protein B
MSDEKTAENQEPEDQGEVVRRAGFRVSWAWLFPIIAAAATAWLFWSEWKSEGPEIEVQFESAPGIQAGKTQLFYRGVAAGQVTGVKLDAGLDKVVLRVRLKAFAADLAREGTIFWIDQPVVSLGETSGLDALIQGNSLQARMGGGSPAKTFVGHSRVPLTPLESPALTLKLRASNIPFLDRGAGVFYRGLQVGSIEDKALDDSGRPYLSLVVDQEFAGTVRSNARFWPVPGASLKVSQGGLKLDVMGLKTILLGGVEFEFFGDPGEAVHDGAEFTLYADQATARATGEPVRIAFRNGQGIVAGQTEVRYRGMPVGLVESAKLNPAGEMVDAVVRFQPAFEHLHAEGTVFTLVRPQISLEGVTGLETLVTGVYIDCAPGTGGDLVRDFTGRSLDDQNLINALAEREGVHVVLYARNLPALGEHAPVLYRGLVAGRVKGRGIDAKNEPYLDVVVRKEFAAAMAANARFWNVPATSVQAGPGMLNIDVANLETLVQGGIAFEVFGAPEGPASHGARFELFPNETAARATSPAIRIAFENGQGLLAGRTQVRHLGLPVGLVESVRTTNNEVEAVIRLNPGHDHLRREGSEFSIVRLDVSLNGVSGLETVVSGIYIECVPAEGGRLVDSFRGVSMEKAEFKQEEERGFEVVVTAPQSSISVDAPVAYRGLVVGKVGRKVLASDGRSVGLCVVINKPYDRLIRDNTRFWDSGGVRVSVGFLAITVQSTSLDALARGGISFATPDVLGAPVRRGHEFPLFKQPRREWLRWAPEFPAED